MNRHNNIVATPSANIQQYIITSHNNNASAQYDENNAAKKTNDELEKHRKLSDWYYIKTNRKSQEQHQQKPRQKQHQDDNVNNVDTMLSKGLLLMTTDDDGDNQILNEDGSENYRCRETTHNNNNSNPRTIKSNKNLSGECDSTNQLNIMIFDEKFNKLSAEKKVKIVPFCKKNSKNDSEKDSKQIILQQNRKIISVGKEQTYYQFNGETENLSRNRTVVSYGIGNALNTARLVKEIDSNRLTTFNSEQPKVCTSTCYYYVTFLQ